MYPRLVIDVPRSPVRPRLRGFFAAVALVAAAAAAGGCGNDPLPFYAADCIDDGCDSGTCYRLSSAGGQTHSFCTAECNGHEDCPGGYCFSLDGDPNGTRGCFQACGDDDDCDSDWLCEDAVNADTGAVEGRICVPPGTAR